MARNGKRAARSGNRGSVQDIDHSSLMNARGGAGRANHAGDRASRVRDWTPSSKGFYHVFFA
jgi:hypothetical protein